MGGSIKMKNSLADKLKEDKLACKIHQTTGCTWEEAFEKSSVELFGSEE